MPAMTSERPIPWLAMREATGLSQREVERQLGWKHGALSWIERGARPTAEQEAQLRAFFRDTLLSQPSETVAV